MKTVVIIIGVFASSLSFAGMASCKNPSHIQLDGKTKMSFCSIPGGTAKIGESGKQIEKDFLPFQMGQFEVTQAQFRAVMGDLPKIENSFLVYGDLYPVSILDAADAFVFAQKLSQMDPQAEYRLPTGAEWEYAARAGTTTKYYYGDELNPEIAFVTESKPLMSGMHAQEVVRCPKEDLHHLVGWCANGFGLMHMSGNVFEITTDHFVEVPNASLRSGHVATRVPGHTEFEVRGGTWDADGRIATSAYRMGFAAGPRLEIGPVRGMVDLGFRLVRFPKGQVRQIHYQRISSQEDHELTPQGEPEGVPAEVSSDEEMEAFEGSGR